MEMVHFIPPGQRRLAMLAAQADTAPALISGASGTGKGAIARWIHENGPRSAQPLVTIKPDQPFIGQAAAAQEGTLILSEIGEFPMAEQMAILSFLKTKTIPHPKSPGLPMLLNARVIATTSHALDARAQGGIFNVELLEKLNVFRIEMPPLAKRVLEFEDIATGILSEISRDLHKEYLRDFSEGAWNELRTYDWPGNLRELRNVLKLAALAAKGDVVERADLPEFGHDRIDFRATREQFERICLMRTR
jgi:DNA-binding NtrC family response regulator